MQDDKRIDSHKLIYHISRVNDWLHGKKIFPVYAEAGVFSGCNHRCVFCAFDYAGYKPVALDKKHIRRFIDEAAANGLKSILYAGEGEPMLHKDIVEIITFTKLAGIDVAVTTNGVFFNREAARETLKHLSWLRISLDAACRNTYSAVHGTQKEDFEKVLNNLKVAVEIRNRNRYDCTIGVQFLLIEGNCEEAAPLAGILREIGVDYLIIKPYSQHPLSMNREGDGIDYRDFFHVKKELENLSDKKFKVIFRRRAMEKITDERPYSRCLGLPFFTYISAEGDVYPCSLFLGKKEFVFGNITKDSFKDIWLGATREKIMEMIRTQWDVNKCRKSCRLDEINSYLRELQNPGPHVNFI